MDYNQIAVGSNGVVYFVNQYLGPGNVCLPDDGSYGVWDFIAGHWDDLNPSAHGAVYYQALNYKGQDIAVVEWYQVPRYGHANRMTWEVVLFSNGSILLLYQTMNGETGNSATVGIQGYWEAPSYYLQYSCNAAALSDNLAICFAYPGSHGCIFDEDVPWVWEEPVTGIVPALSTGEVGVTVTSYLTEPMPLGTYTAPLLLVNNAAEGTQKLPAIMHIVEEFIPPTASFESNSPVCLGEPMVFTDTSDPGVPAQISWAWDFGDGGTSNEQNPTHLYAAPGLYTVTLTIIQAQTHLTDTYSMVVEVLPLPEAAFTYTVSGLVVTFTNSSQNATAHLWSFGDGITSTLENPVHTYAEAGTYTVVLTATNTCGLDTYSVVLRVAPARYTIYLPLVFKGYTQP